MGLVFHRVTKAWWCVSFFLKWLVGQFIMNSEHTAFSLKLTWFSLLSEVINIWIIFPTSNRNLNLFDDTLHEFYFKKMKRLEMVLYNSIFFSISTPITSAFLKQSMILYELMYSPGGFLYICYDWTIHHPSDSWRNLIS